MRDNYPPGAAADANAPYNQAADHADAPHVTQYVDERKVDLDGVRDAINDAREEALIRQQGREAAEEMD